MQRPFDQTLVRPGSWHQLQWRSWAHLLFARGFDHGETLLIQFVEPVVHAAIEGSLRSWGECDRDSAGETEHAPAQPRSLPRPHADGHDRDVDRERAIAGCVDALGGFESAAATDAWLNFHAVSVAVYG